MLTCQRFLDTRSRAIIGVANTKGRAMAKLDATSLPVRPTYEELQAEILRSMVVKQDLINARNALDRDLERFQAMHAFSTRAIQLQNSRDLPMIVVESAIEAFEVECGAVFTRTGKQPSLRLTAFYGVPCAAPECRLDVASIERKGDGRSGSAFIEPAGGESPWVQLGLHQVMVAPLFDTDGSIEAALMCGISTAKRDFYRELNDDVLPSFMVFAQQAATIMHNLQSREVIGQQLNDLHDVRDDLERALAEVRRLTARLEEENDYLREEVELAQGFGGVVGESEPVRAMLATVRVVARTEATVLVLGETGTGKELVARAVHGASNRSNRPLIKVNCAALPAELIESELFGHERGAFTGAHARRAGRFELADGGTIFLDEIAELSPALQARLLRVLQDGEFERVGGERSLRVDVRVIAATNRDVQAAVVAGEFREDLYYRLNVFPIRCPPLRERAVDVPILAQHFLHRFSTAAGGRVTSIPSDVLERLERYHWPGNVRELMNVIERAVILSSGPELELAEPIGPSIAADSSSERLRVTGVPGDRGSTTRHATNRNGFRSLAECERDHIVKVLDQTGWRIRGRDGAAEILELKATTLEARMARLGILRPVR
ncbi:MAG: AAA family ATPase [Spirochaetaceae bacterium]|nr:MAG: AAA family ATPase [Spirochaetaceae bacterium]